MVSLSNHGALHHPGIFLSAAVYKSKNGKDTKVFPPLEWLVATRDLQVMSSHIPNQVVRYYGYYSNVAREKHKEAGSDDVIPCILEPKENS